MSKENIKNMITGIIVFLLLIGTLIFKFIPEYQATKGSSDTYIDIKNYESLVEIKINEQINFSLILSNSKITNILFYNDKTLCLYNKEIESTSIEKGMKIIVEELLKNNYIKQYSQVTITKYNEKYYEKVKNEFLLSLQRQGIEITVNENNLTLEEKVKTLNIEVSETDDYLRALELYSKEIIRINKNNLSSLISEDNVSPTVKEKDVKKYTDAVYNKILKFMSANNIANQDINSSTLPIILIPANVEGTIYPNSDSWYYIKDGNVFAYISITTDDYTYGYCYEGSINKYKKGQC